MPVADVRLVPYLEVPLQHAVSAVALRQVSRDHADQLAPFGVVLGRIIGSSGGRILRIAHLIRHVVVRQFGRQVLRHESKLDQGPHAGLLIGIEDAIENREVVHRLAVRVLAVDVGRTPFEVGNAVTGGQEMMGTDRDRHGTQVMQLAQQSSAVGRCSVVGLVVTEPRVQRLVRADGLGKINVDRHIAHGRRSRRARCLRVKPRGAKQRECSRENDQLAHRYPLRRAF